MGQFDLIDMSYQKNKKSKGEMLSGALDSGMQMLGQHQQKQQQSEALKNAGMDPSVMNLPEQAQAEYFKQKFKPQEGMTALQQSQLNLNEAKLSQTNAQENLFNQIRPKQSTGQQLQNGEPQQGNENQSQGGLETWTDAQLRQMASYKGQPGESGIYANQAQQILDDRDESKTIKQKKSEILREEVAPIKKNIFERGQSAKKGIENKKQALSMIDSGQINDPTFAIVMESLPFKLGERMLSPETQVYRASLVDNYADLKSLFPGAVRVKEIEILEKKIADLYLTDEQKKAILESRIDAHEADIIRADVAEEIEEEGKEYGMFKYEKELEARAKPRLDALFNRIVDKQKFIMKDAENVKNTPLILSNPEHLEIIDQFLKQAKGNPEIAKKNAKKAGYSW